MKLAISNIAWSAEDEKVFFKYIKEWGCSGVEIAPSRVWADPLQSTQAERRAFKSLTFKYGLEIPALQALLYNRPDLGIFRGREIERETVEYVKGLCQVAGDLGARVLVFGSPRNRRRGDLPMEEALVQAAGFFAKVAPTAKALGVCVCIEPLRPEETDFITTALEGLRLVEMVNNPGFGLHLDAKAVNAEPGEFLATFRRVLPKMEHFHINDPGLVEVNSTGKVAHASLAQALHEAGYRRYVSIEMRFLPDHYQVVQRSIGFAKETYVDFFKNKK